MTEVVVVREENHSAPNQNQTTNINPGPGYKTASGTRKKDVKGNDVAEHKENHSARQTPNTMNPNEKWSSRCQGTRQPVGSRDHKELY